MVTKYRNPKKVSVTDYLANKENSGRVAVFDLGIPAIVAEGDGTDWVELELMYESLREQGDYELVIVRGYEPTVTRFERLPV
ncbi:MAG: hypothetical protein IJ679_09450 [Lachnospiraceae bacterium]|nr:hypothetical protein [Lachnospiraceae bacterium]